MCALEPLPEGAPLHESPSLCLWSRARSCALLIWFCSPHSQIIAVIPSHCDTSSFCWIRMAISFANIAHFSADAIRCAATRNGSGVGVISNRITTAIVKPAHQPQAKDQLRVLHQLFFGSVFVFNIMCHLSLVFRLVCAVGPLPQTVPLHESPTYRHSP